jgi:hypothetical protein
VRNKKKRSRQPQQQPAMLEDVFSELSKKVPSAAHDLLEGGKMKKALRFSFRTAFLGLAVLVATSCRQSQEQVAAKIGDIELAEKEVATITRLTQVRPSASRVSGLSGTTRTYSNAYEVTWHGGMVETLFEANTDDLETADASIIPRFVLVRQPFRGSLHGVHLGDSCVDAARRLQLPAQNLSDNHTGERSFNNGQAKWEEDNNHKIVELSVNNKFAGMSEFEATMASKPQHSPEPSRGNSPPSPTPHLPR